VCLADGVGERESEAFLRDHALLLSQLPAWTLVIVGPKHTADFASSERAFNEFCGRGAASSSKLDIAELPWYCQTRKAVEANRFDGLSVTDINRYREFRRRHESPRVEALYQEWLLTGQAALDRYGPMAPSTKFANARFETRVLPFRYDQFGDLPGVC
jgi:hypothetical protein